MSAATEHPPLLLSYVARHLEPGPTAEVAAHLLRCTDCRLEVDALTSMMKSLRLQNRTDHIRGEDLVAYEEFRIEDGPAAAVEGSDAGELARDSVRRRRIEAHLQDCAECRFDLHALERARRVQESLEAAPARTRRTAAGVTRALAALRSGWTGAALAATAAAAILAIVLVPRIGTRPEPRPGLQPARPITFEAPRRGAAGERILPPEGPWSITIGLPFDAPEGTYHLLIRRADGSAVDGLEARLPSDGNGSLTVLVSALDAPGSYRLILEPESATSGATQAPGRAAGAAAAGPYVYPFKVAPPSARAPAARGARER
jgi:hypothetical protein